MNTQQWVIDFLSDLGLLLESGAELDAALVTLSSSTANDEQQNLLGELIAGVRAGGLFNQQLGRFPSHFDGVVCGMVAAGEAAGDLPTALELVTEQLSRAQELRSKIINALIYPAILCGVLLVSLLLILLLILPQLAAVVDSFGGSQSALVNGLVGFGVFADHWGMWFLALTGFAGALLWLFRHDIADRIPSAWPSPLRPLRTKLELARLTGTLSSLLGAGLSQTAALDIACRGLPQGARKESLRLVIERVQQGERLSDAVQAMGDVGDLIAHGIRAGEQSGRLADTLARLSKRLEREFTVAAERLAAVAQPVLIIVMGLAIGSVVLIVFSALQSVGQFDL
ncbi:type II secretion system F family protein [Arenicella xantha]|uniref:General secretion pathway protein F n=1 Tax=Arenicella xantha TaxID=644221 RepID=A0A395JHM0_9GAMM|nr:type II secretion system F family protein [Arenicella xantha]RBP47145.1 general secretion pathway protein F [Arenicella xantha]